MAKKKRQGHYCKICCEYKANEKFSGKGNRNHICKKCHSLPVSKRNEMVNIQRIDSISESFLISKEKQGRLKKYAKDKRYPESSEYAKNVLENYYAKMDDYNGVRNEKNSTSVTFKELEKDVQDEVIEYIEQDLELFFSMADYLPSKKEIDLMLTEFCNEAYSIINRSGDEEDLYNFNVDFMSDEFGLPIFEEDYDFEDEIVVEKPKPKNLVIDDDFRTVFNNIFNRFIDELKEDGFELLSFWDTYTIFETERLIVRQFLNQDLDSLFRIMAKEQVMYAWEKGFKKKEVKKWLNSQLERYRTDGYGYFGVYLKNNKKLIGQVGIMDSRIDDEEVVEIGYIFDSKHWNNGYCIEAVKELVNFAFNGLCMDKLHCTIRPENLASIKVAEKLGMKQIGEYVKIYDEKEMLHNIYILENKNLM